jgi:hypothetical protein
MNWSNRSPKLKTLVLCNKFMLESEPQINEYNGRISVELTVKDLQLA